MRFLLILCCIFLLPKGEVNATHIVGGNLTYRCLGGNQYEVRLSLRRDCLLGADDAQFDNPASIGFYDATTDLPLFFVGFGGELLMDFNADDTLNQILVSDCSVAGNPVCVHQTTYVDTIFLPFWANGYKMVYQRCCRNGSVQNIMNPLLTGMTLVSELSATAQTVCKSSPQLGFYPPVYICVNKDIDFFLPATDSQNDSLVFSLATPFSGGDIVNNMPQPPNPPPYDLIVWRPPYSLANVMGGIPLAIDPSTGHITGRPNTVGQFVITIVIESYRNGTKLCETRVDFQYNVRECHDVPTASFVADSLTCDGLTVNFINTSINSDRFLWLFDYGNDDGDSSTVFSPTYTYDEEGFYDVGLISFDSLNICFDTVVHTIGVFETEITADFSYSSMDCTDSITLNAFDLSTSSDFPIVQWEWLLTHPGGAIPSNAQNPTFPPFDADEELSTVFLVLIVTDSVGCTASEAKSFPVREFGIELNPDADSICNLETVHLLLNGDSTLTYTWSPANNGLDLTNPWDPIAFPGISVEYFVTVTDGVCTLTDSIFVNVQQLPNLCFEYETACNNLTVDFTNCSTNAIGYHWDFGDPTVADDTSSLASPSYTYDQPGIYIVTLSSTDGCDVFITDTITANTVQDSLDDQTVNCFQESIGLNPDGNPDYDYVWTPAQFLDDATSHNPQATVEDDTWFYVTITDPAFPDCGYEDSILLIIPDDFDIEIDGPDSITVCSFDTLTFTATLTGNTNVEVNWKDLEGNILGTGFELSVTPQVTTSYVVMATDTLGCMKFDTITVFKPDPTFEVIATNDSTYCYIQTITLTVTSVAGVTFEWFNANNELIGTGPSVEVTPGVHSCFHVIGTDPLGCQAADTVCLSPTYFALIITTEDEQFCDDESAILNVNVIDGVTYEWFNSSDELLGTGPSVTVSPNVLSCFYVVGTDSLGCQDTDTACVNPIYFDASISGEQAICIGDPNQLCVVDNFNQNLTYIWAPGGETTECITVSPNDETTYTVTVTNEDLGCKDTLNFTVEIYEFDPAIVITADPPDPYLGETSQLTVNQNPNFQYEWSATPTETVAPVFNPIVTPSASSTYCVTVTDDHGCTGTACYSFSLPELFCDERDIFVPNAFTPNDDDENDIFMVRTNYMLTDVEMRIYNRWGEQVFSTNDINLPWDGTFNGQELSPDVFGYFLSVTCPNGERYFKKGNVTLLH